MCRQMVFGGQAAPEHRGRGRVNGPPYMSIGYYKLTRPLNGVLSCMGPVPDSALRSLKLRSGQETRRKYQRLPEDLSLNPATDTKGMYDELAKVVWISRHLSSKNIEYRGRDWE